MAKRKITTTYTDVNYTSQRYCFKKGLRITVEPHNGKYRVWYVLGSKSKYYLDGKEFTEKEANQSVWDLYTKIYNYDKKK